ncbi:MAG: ZIP family metal transporter [Candidatus Thermoplasmatota archaeon]
MNRRTAVLALLLLAPLASAASSGDLYLRADGSLAAEPGSASNCLTLATGGANTVTGTFEGAPFNGTYAVPEQSALLSLAFAQGATPGTGFTVAATLAIGSAPPAQASKAYGAGTAVDSPATLAFSVPAADNVTGPVVITVTLTKTGPAPLGQSVSIVCGSPSTRLHAIQANLAAPPGPGGDDGGDVTSGSGLSLPWVLGIAVLAGAITLLAGVMAIAGRTVSQRRIHFLLGATAGLLLAIAVLDLIPEAIELNEAAPFTIVGGLVVLFLVRHFAGDHGHDHAGHPHDAHDAEDEHGHEEAHDAAGHERVATHAAGLALVAFFALGFHRFVDGLVLPAAFELDSAVGFAAASAVLIHQFPDGIAAASVFLAAAWRRRKVLGGIAIMAALTPVGSLVGIFLVGSEKLVGHLVALAAATFIFIALAELLPELRAREQRMPVGLGFGVGIIVALIVVLIPAMVGIEV